MSEAKPNSKAILGPLEIQFGFGRVAVCGFRDKLGAGVVFSDCGSTHNVGDKLKENRRSPHKPQKGEVYLHFANIKSLDVVLDAMIEAKQDLIKSAIENQETNDGK